MHCRKLLTFTAVLATLGCATQRASERIPYVAVPTPDPINQRVMLVVIDARIPNAPNPAEDVLSNDVVQLFRNRLELELARNGVVSDDASATRLRVEIYDYRYHWSRPGAFVDYRVEAFARARVVLTRDHHEVWSHTIIGRAKTSERDWQPVVTVADQLERALDDAMRDAHERRLFATLGE